MPMVHDLYFRPQHEAFMPRNLWSLSNAFTSAFKKLAPVKQFETTARLGAYLSDVQKGLKLKRQLDLGFPLQMQDEPIRQTTEQSGKILQMPYAASQNNPNPSSNTDLNNFNRNNQPNNRGYEDFDEDDVAEDPYDELDDYFDEEEETEAIDEAVDEMMEEFERKAA